LDEIADWFRRLEKISVAQFWRQPSASRQNTDRRTDDFGKRQWTHFNNNEKGKKQRWQVYKEFFSAFWWPHQLLHF